MNNVDSAVNLCTKSKSLQRNSIAVEEGTDINTAKAVADEDMTAVKKPRKLVRLPPYGIFLQCQSHLLLTFRFI
jgi:hypothetical protein